MSLWLGNEYRNTLPQDIQKPCLRNRQIRLIEQFLMLLGFAIGLGPSVHQQIYDPPVSTRLETHVFHHKSHNLYGPFMTCA